MSQEVAYRLGAYDSDEDAYEGLINAISEVKENLARNTYTVIWKTTTHNHGAEYRVVDTNSRTGEDTLIIEGQGRGGKYEIYPKPNDPPFILYHHPEGRIGWEENAVGLIITEGMAKFEYDEESGVAIFDDIKERLNL